ncbi:MAG: hypothetical protein QXS42_02400 [Zestosphaera sp.]
MTWSGSIPLGLAFKPRRELGRILKKGRPSDLKVGVFLPMPYSAAVNSVFMHLAYSYLNSIEGVRAFRYVYDAKEDVVEALDLNLSPKKLDVLMISASFELDYLYVARALAGLGILPEGGEGRPLIIVGGVAPTANPLPLARIADAVVVGEAEPVFDRVIDCMGSADPLRRLSEEEHIVTFPPEGVKRRAIVHNLDDAITPERQVHPLDEEPTYGHGIRVEVSRGCRRFCAFCLEGHATFPLRCRSLDRLKGLISRGLETSPKRRVVFYSLSFFDVPHSEELLRWLISEGVEYSIPSLRPDYLSESRIELVRCGGQNTLTVAPETLLPDVSCSIGKCVSSDHLESILDHAAAKGFRHVKLYLITGFPSEDAELSVRAVGDLIKGFLKGRRVPPKFIRLSINPLIPKPWTPFQYLPAYHVKQREKNLEVFRRYLSGRFVEIETYSVEWSFVQAVIALGDTAVSDLIVDLGMRGVSLGSFRRVIRESGLSRLAYIMKGWSEPPWMKYLDLGIDRRYLETRFRILNPNPSHE